MLPLAVALPERPSIEASSRAPGGVAVLAMLSVFVADWPRCSLPKSIGSFVWIVAIAGVSVAAFDCTTPSTVSVSGARFSL